MELIVIIVYSALLPILTIGAFVVGYNVNAQKKLFHHVKKQKPTSDVKPTNDTKKQKPTSDKKPSDDAKRK